MARGKRNREGFSRRGFVRATGAAFLAGAAGFASQCGSQQQQTPQAQSEPSSEDSVRTNISTAMAVPKQETSMPGPFPGVVAEVVHTGATAGQRPNHCDPTAAMAMLAAAMSSLTGEKDARDAWARFFTPGERIGIKVNPVGGKLLSNTHELIHAIINSLEQIGTKRGDIVIWDREEDLLFDAKYTPENYPGVRCVAMCYPAEENGKKVIRGLDRIDENVFYEFDIEEQYDSDVAPYMLHTGRRSHFAKLVTEELDKIINAAVLKNMGPTATLCLKNISYGSTSNCSRGHAIMNRYIAEVCAFPPLRDKVVLNIVDGLRGCYEGGPAAQAHYIWEANTIWAGTDPVSLDSVCWDLIAAKRIEKGAATPEKVEEGRRDYDFLVRAENLGLGVFNSRKIDHRITRLA